MNLAKITMLIVVDIIPLHLTPKRQKGERHETARPKNSIKFRLKFSEWKSFEFLLTIEYSEIILSELYQITFHMHF